MIVGHAQTTATFAETFLAETVSLLNEIDADQVEAVARGLASVRNGGGRLFILGVGGSAGQARHAVNDFRTICGFEAYTPGDDMWGSTFSTWLTGSRLTAADAILVLSVGGGDQDKEVSMNLLGAIDVAKQLRASVFGVVGWDGGHTEQSADACVVIPPMFIKRIAPHTEGLLAVVWHLLVNHPVLRPTISPMQFVASK